MILKLTFHSKALLKFGRKNILTFLPEFVFLEIRSLLNKPKRGCVYFEFKLIHHQNLKFNIGLIGSI